MSQTYEKEFDDLLIHLNSYLGISEFEKDDENSYTIVSDDLFISLINQEGMLTFLTNIGSLHEYNQQEYIKNYLLSANVMFYATHGGTFGISEDGIIAFCYQHPIAALSNETFIHKLDVFVSTLEAYIEKIKSIEQEIPTTKGQELFVPSEQEGIAASENWQKV